MKVVIVEDESLMADLLSSKLLQADPSITILAKLPSIKDAIDYIEKNGFPDLFFSDIELTDGLSFEIFKRTQNRVPIIFCTAYNHYALEAFQVYGIDYILKPFDLQDLERALTKYRSLIGAAVERQPIDYQSVLQFISQQKAEQKNSILIYKGDEILPLKLEEIALAGLDHGSLYIYTFNLKKYVAEQNMEQLSALLPDDFYRLNRQFIINRKAVASVSQFFARKLLVYPTIKFDEKLIVSKANVKHFLQWLEAH